VCFFDVASAQAPCDVLSRGELLLTCLSQGIVSGFCGCNILQKCLDAITFVIEELFEFQC
jgi:hypothetical protein